jgi:glycosyltransferase involved in cell wall biosynthesis
VIHHPVNRGLAASRNTGIRASNSSLIALVDADDRLHHDFLRATHATIDRGPFDYMAVDWQVFGDRDEVWEFPLDDSVNCPAHFLFVGSGLIMRRKVWELVGGYCEHETLRGGEDWDFWISAAERGARPGRLAQALYQYRIHSAAMTNTTARINSHRFRRLIFDRHPAAFQSMGLDCPRCSSSSARRRSFLGLGYAVSASAFLENRQRLRAMVLATRACLLQPKNRSYRRQLIRAAFPASVRAKASRILKARRR